MLIRALAFLFTAMAAITVFAEPLYFVAPDADDPVTVLDSSIKTIPGGAPDIVVSENGITFNIFLTDVRTHNGIGFDSATVGANARARLQDALRYIADVINETGTLDIVVTASETDGSGALAFAGTFYTVAPGFQTGITLQRLSTGIKPFAGNEEISCTVDFGFDWNFTNGAPTGSQADFRSVITHEFTHGLGFASLANATGTSQIGVGTYTTYDALLRRRTGNKVLFSGAPPAFVGSVADLVSTDLMFFGTQANALYAQPTRPGIFAPNPFQSGSSLSHWDTGNIVGGAVMEHAITFGVQRRSYAPVDIGALIDIGYVNATAPTGAPGDLTVSPNPGSAVNIGSTNVGVAITKTFTVTNGGGTALNVTTSAAAPFGIQSGASFTLPAGASGSVIVRFTPSAVGAASGNLNIFGDPDGTIIVPLSGTGTGVPAGNLVTSPVLANINFGSLASGASGVQSFTLTNNGGQSITGQATTSGAPFTVTVGASYTLAAGANTTVTVQFAPTDTTDFTGVLSLTGDPDGTIAINLAGTGTKAANASCSAVKGQYSAWSVADALVIVLCGAVLVGSARKTSAVRVRK